MHTHLLPDVDDGSRSLGESIETLKMHASQGCTTVVCTPHISPTYPNSESIIKQKYYELKEAISESSLDVTLYYGAEYYGETLFEKIMNDEPLIFLNNEDASKRYLLVEFSFAIKPLWLDKLIDRLAEDNISIVVAHPERYYRNVAVFKKMVDHCDCLFALNSSSILGEEGARVKSNAFSFISHHGSKIFWSSDTHPALQRYPHFDIMLEEEDLTSDDLKILLIGYKTEEQIAEKIRTTEKIPLMLKKNEKYDCLQVLINYKDIKDKPNIEVDIISILATEDINRDIVPKMPDELRFICTTIKGNTPSNNRGTANN